jgi:hypothetical protein
MREVGRHRAAASSAIDGSGPPPLPLPDWSTLAPGSPEAIELLNSWRPVLYGYARHVMDLVEPQLDNVGMGEFGLIAPTPARRRWELEVPHEPFVGVDEQQFQMPHSAPRKCL